MKDLEFLENSLLNTKELWKKELEGCTQFDHANLDYIEGKLYAVSYFIEFLRYLEGKNDKGKL